MAKNVAPNTLEVKLTHSKSTKGTHVFVNAEHEISWYFPKTLAIFKGDEAPKQIVVTLEV